MFEKDLPLVPPARLAVLLTTTRRERGLDLADVAQRSDRRFSVAMLDQIEKGQVQLDEATLRDLTQLYGLESDEGLPNRSKLILDLDTKQLAVGDTAVRFERSTTDDVLERYVSLLYLLRNEQPGRVLSLRDDDLDVLGTTLGLPIGRLTSELSALMGASSTSQTTSRLSRHLSLAAAGLLVGVTAAGSLIIVGGGDSTVVVQSVAERDVPTAVAASHDGIQRGDRGVTTTAGVGDAVLARVDTQTRPTIILSSSVAPAPVTASSPNQATLADAVTEQDVAPAGEIADETASEVAVEGEQNATPAEVAPPEVGDAVEVVEQAEVTPPVVGDVVEVTGQAEVAPPVVGDASDTTESGAEVEPQATGEEAAAAPQAEGGPEHPKTIEEVAAVLAEVEAAEAAPPAASNSGTAIGLESVESLLGRDLHALVPGWTIEVINGNAGHSAAGHRGLTNRSERSIMVYAGQSSTISSVAEVLVHEIGHAIDLDRLDTESRLQWIEMRGMPKVWWTGDGLSDFAVGAGDFAEGVAAYLAGSPSNSHYGEFNAEQLAFVAQYVG